MRDSDFKRSTWLIILSVAIASSIAIGRVLPVEAEVEEVVKKKVVYVQAPGRRQNYGPVEEYDDVCQGFPGEVRSVSSSKGSDGEWDTWFVLRPVHDSFSVPCQIEGRWDNEFPVGSIISIPKGTVSG